MKTIISLLGGAVVLTESGGVFTLALTESVGGGQASGIVKGSGSVILDGNVGLQLGEALLNAHLPATMQPMASVVEAVVNTSIRALE